VWVSHCCHCPQIILVYFLEHVMHAVNYLDQINFTAPCFHRACQHLLSSHKFTLLVITFHNEQNVLLTSPGMPPLDQAETLLLTEPPLNFNNQSLAVVWIALYSPFSPKHNTFCSSDWAIGHWNFCQETADCVEVW